VKLYDLITAVEERTGPHTQTTRFLNEAQLQLALDSEQVKKENINFTSGVANIPANRHPVDVLWDGLPLDFVKANMYIYDDTCDPVQWTVIDGQIVLNTKASGTQKLLSVPRPATMDSDEDTPDLADCDSALIAYARWKVYEDLENVEKANYWRGIWYEKKEEWLKIHGKTTRRTRRVKALPWA